MGKMRLIAAAALALAIAGAALWLASGDPSRILLEDVVATVVETDGTPTIAITATIRNDGGPDRLTGAAAPGAKLAMLAGEEDLTGLVIPAGGAPSLAMDGAHVMLMGIEAPPADGQLIPFTLTFAGAGVVAAKARVSVPAGMAGMSGMDHGAHVMTPPEAAPSVTLSAAPTPTGWRISAETTRFRFAPDAMDGPHEPGEGHAHLYIGGLKIIRMTAPEVEIGALPAGRHVVRVTLNANDHRTYVSGGAPVSAEVEITAP